MDASTSKKDTLYAFGKYDLPPTDIRIVCGTVVLTHPICMKIIFPNERNAHKIHLCFIGGH